LRERAPAVPPGLAALAERAMSHDPAERFPSVHALGRALLPYASEGRRSLWREVFDRSVTLAGFAPSTPSLDATPSSLPPTPPPVAAPRDPPPHDTEPDLDRLETPRIGRTAPTPARATPTRGRPAALALLLGGVSLASSLAIVLEFYRPTPS